MEWTERNGKKERKKERCSLPRDIFDLSHESRNETRNFSKLASRGIEMRLRRERGFWKNEYPPRRSHVSNANAWHLRCNNSRTRRKAVIRELQPRSPSTRGTKGGDGGGKEEKRKDARMRALINGGPLQLRDSEPYHRSRRVDRFFHFPRVFLRRRSTVSIEDFRQLLRSRN